MPKFKSHTKRSAKYFMRLIKNSTSAEPCSFAWGHLGTDKVPVFLVVDKPAAKGLMSPLRAMKYEGANLPKDARPEFHPVTIGSIARSGKRLHVDTEKEISEERINKALHHYFKDGFKLPTTLRTDCDVEFIDDEDEAEDEPASGEEESDGEDAGEPDDAEAGSIEQIGKAAAPEIPLDDRAARKAALVQKLGNGGLDWVQDNKPDFDLRTPRFDQIRTAVDATCAKLEGDAFQAKLERLEKELPKLIVANEANLTRFLGVTKLATASASAGPSSAAGLQTLAATGGQGEGYEMTVLGGSVSAQTQGPADDPGLDAGGGEDGDGDEADGDGGGDDADDENAPLLGGVRKRSLGQKFRDKFKPSSAQIGLAPFVTGTQAPAAGLGPGRNLRDVVFGPGRNVATRGNDQFHHPVRVGAAADGVAAEGRYIPEVETGPLVSAAVSSMRKANAIAATEILKPPGDFKASRPMPTIIRTGHKLLTERNVGDLGPTDAATALARWNEQAIADRTAAFFPGSNTAQLIQIASVADRPDDTFPLMQRALLIEAIGATCGGNIIMANEVARTLSADGLDLSPAACANTDADIVQDRAWRTAQLLALSSTGGDALWALLPPRTDTEGDEGQRKEALIVVLQAGLEFSKQLPARDALVHCTPGAIMQGIAAHPADFANTQPAEAFKAGLKVARTGDTAELDRLELRAFWTWSQGFDDNGKGSALAKADQRLEKATGIWFDRMANKPTAADRLKRPLGMKKQPYSALSLGVQGAQLRYIHEVDIEFDREILEAATALRRHLTEQLPIVAEAEIVRVASDIAELDYWIGQTGELTDDDVKDDDRVRPTDVENTPAAQQDMANRARVIIADLHADAVAREDPHAMVRYSMAGQRVVARHPENIFKVKRLRELGEGANLPAAAGNLPATDVSLPKLENRATSEGQTAGGADQAVAGRVGSPRDQWSDADRFRIAVDRAQKIDEGNVLKLLDNSIEGVELAMRKTNDALPLGDRFRQFMGGTAGLNNARFGISNPTGFRFGPDARFTRNVMAVMEQNSGGHGGDYFVGTQHTYSMAVGAYGSHTFGDEGIGSANLGFRIGVDDVMPEGVRLRAHRKLDENDAAIKLDVTDDAGNNVQKDGYRVAMDEIFDIYFEHAKQKRDNRPARDTDGQVIPLIDKLIAADPTGEKFSLTYQSHQNLTARVETSGGLSILGEHVGAAGTVTHEGNPFVALNRSDHNGSIQRTIVQVGTAQRTTPGVSAIVSPPSIPLPGDNSLALASARIGSLALGMAETGTIYSSRTVHYKGKCQPHLAYRDVEYRSLDQYVKGIEERRSLWEGTMGKANVDNLLNDAMSTDKPAQRFTERWRATPQITYMDGAQATARILEESKDDGEAGRTAEENRRRRDDVERRRQAEQAMLSSVMASETVWEPLGHFILETVQTEPDVGLRLPLLTLEASRFATGDHELYWSGLSTADMNKAPRKPKAVPSGGEAAA